MDETDRKRRHNAKRFNERMKLIASTLNNTAVATIIGVIVLPGASGRFSSDALPWIGAIFILHSLAQIVLTFLQSED